MKIIKKFYTGLLLVLTISLSGCNPVPVINGARRAPAAAKTVGRRVPADVKIAGISSIIRKPSALGRVLRGRRSATGRVLRGRRSATGRGWRVIITDLNREWIKNIKIKGICDSNCDEIIKSFKKAGFRPIDIKNNFVRINNNTWKITKMTDELALSLKNKKKIIMPGKLIMFKKTERIKLFQNDVYTKMGDDLILVIPESKMKEMMPLVDLVESSFLAKYRKLNSEESKKVRMALKQELVGKDIFTLK